MHSPLTPLLSLEIAFSFLGVGEGKDIDVAVQNYLFRTKHYILG